MIGTRAGGIPDFVFDGDNGSARAPAATPTHWPRPSIASSPTTSCGPGSPSGAASPPRAAGIEARADVVAEMYRHVARRAGPGAVARARRESAHGHEVRAAPRQRRGEAARPGRRRPRWPRSPTSCCAPTTTATVTWRDSSDSASTCAASRGDPPRRAAGARRAADPQRLGGPVLQRRARRRGAPGRRRGPRRPAAGGVPPDGPGGAPRGGGAAVLDLHNVESALVRSYARIGRGPEGLLAHAEAAALAAMERALMPVVRHRGRGERTGASSACPPGSATCSSAPTAGTPTRRPAAARPDPHGRLRGHHGVGPQRRRRAVVRRRGVARGAPAHARGPPAARRPGPGPLGPGPCILIGGGFRYRFRRPPVPCRGASGGSSAAVRRGYPPEDP